MTTDATTPEPSRRDFLYITTGMAAVVGVGAVAGPFIDQMQPDASTLALSSVEVDISSLQPGMSLTVKWRGKPVFIRNRTPEEVEKAKQVPLDDLKDPVARNANLPADAPATDPNRSGGAGEGSKPVAASASAPADSEGAGKENWLIMVGVCTHLGCIPLGQQGEFGGWFCPCHGSQYDTAGRIRKGPAPENMAIPVYQCISDTKIRIG